MGFVGGLGFAVEECLDGGSPVHAAALVGPLMVVFVKECVEVVLHLDDVIVKGGAALDAEVFVEEGAVEAFEVSVALRAADLGGAVFDAFELEEEFVGVVVRASAELAPVVGEDGLDGDLEFLEEGQDVVVEEVDGGQRHLGGVEAGEGVAGMAVDGGLGVDAPDALEMADMESVHGEQRAGVWGVDVALAELGVEAFQQPDLFVGELDGAFAGVLLEAKESVVFGEQVVAFPDAPDPARGDSDLAKGEFLGDAEAAMGGELQAVGEDGVLDLLGQAVGMGFLGAGEAVEEAFCTEGLEVAADLVELLPGVSHNLAGLGNVVEVGGEFEQAELAAGDFLFSGHVGVLVWFWWYKTLTRTTWPLSASEASNCQVNTITLHSNEDGGCRAPLPFDGETGAFGP